MTPAGRLGVGRGRERPPPACAQRLLTAASARWAPAAGHRTNHRGEPVTLLEGPASPPGWPLRPRWLRGSPAGSAPAAVVAAVGAGGFGALRRPGRQRRPPGSARATSGRCARGEVTTGAVKIVGIGATGLAARRSRGRRRRRRLVLAGGRRRRRGQPGQPARPAARPGAQGRCWSLALLAGRPGGDSAPLAAAAAGAALGVLPARPAASGRCSATPAPTRSARCSAWPP